ncbi:hypothetical protein [Pelagibius sp. Alg239-R121]|uniref:hypothetical protein n=1 Tax=Pelagibius sp. Alg239-R121 TaxID=2993448 RepID=UPI0024A74B1A|nr:hypothetical protein [Pelagibius sp. Alg239-R121]
MVELIDKLKTEARLLHRKAAEGDSAALARIRKVHEDPKLDDAELKPAVKRRHCLGAIARDLGFDGWAHAVQVIKGNNSRDFGKMLYPHGCSAHSNIWSASYAEARKIHDDVGGYLLAYRHHYFIVDADYIRTLGLDPEDSDWQAIGYDWVKPKSTEARERLYSKVVQVQFDR